MVVLKLLEDSSDDDESGSRYRVEYRQHRRVNNHQTKGWEIVRYVPRRDYNFFMNWIDGVLREPLKKSVKQTLNIVAEELKSKPVEDIVFDAHPISFNASQSVDMNDDKIGHLVKSIESTNKKAGRRFTTSAAGEVPVSFQLPNDFPPHHINIDMLPIREKGWSSSGGVPIRQYRFSERLKGWTVLRRQRLNGKFDTYYRHDESNITLRSVIELLNFLLYEETPGKNKTPNKTTLANILGSNDDNQPKLKRSYTKRKSKHLNVENDNSQQKRKRVYRKRNSKGLNSQNLNEEPQQIGILLSPNKGDDGANENFKPPEDDKHLLHPQFKADFIEKQDCGIVIGENKNTGNFPRGTLKIFPSTAKTADDLFRSSYESFHFSKKSVTKEDNEGKGKGKENEKEKEKEESNEKPKDDDDQDTDTEETCSDSMVDPTTDYYFGGKIKLDETLLSTCTSAYSKVPIDIESVDNHGHDDSTNFGSTKNDGDDQGSLKPVKVNDVDSGKEKGKAVFKDDDNGSAKKNNDIDDKDLRLLTSFCESAISMDKNKDKDSASYPKKG
ncbi:uncharacterized protein LOC133038719 [Cannabis sativa]|uniref:uncharacterized protein LOC133038719 n=1 Tax=Cannabis sativa TaxID=3483 RepID=UPI0029CA35CB|nr:uncharacterized protein LOC133038719 [Cannabis sativa]